MSQRYRHEHDQAEVDLIARTHAVTLHVSKTEALAAERRDDEDLINQLREVNQELVLATLRSHELAEEAEEAHALVALRELRFRSLVKAVAAIVWTADADGWVRFDPQWHVLTGLVVGGPPSQWDWLEGVHVADREHVRATWAASVASGSVYECEHRLSGRDAGCTWVQARAVPVRGDRGQVLEWIGMMDDITSRKLVEEARERFIGVLGHDLRTPLTAINMGAASMATSGDLPARHLRTVEIVGKCAGRMGRMIGDVLDFARGRLGGGIPLTPQLTNFGRICRDVVTELVTIHPDRRIVLETSGDLVGVWDVDRVQQVVANLVGNAVEHGGDPVRLSVRDDGDDVVLVVNNKNLGPPVPAELLPLLFEPFRRGAAGDESSSGLGLGLYIVSEIVRAHRGTIVVTSSEAEGTTFTSRWSRYLRGR